LVSSRIKTIALSTVLGGGSAQILGIK